MYIFQRYQRIFTCRYLQTSLAPPLNLPWTVYELLAPQFLRTGCCKAPLTEPVYQQRGLADGSQVLQRYKAALAEEKAGAMPSMLQAVEDTLRTELHEVTERTETAIGKLAAHDRERDAGHQTDGDSSARGSSSDRAPRGSGSQVDHDELARECAVRVQEVLRADRREQAAKLEAHEAKVQALERTMHAHATMIEAVLGELRASSQQQAHDTPSESSEPSAHTALPETVVQDTPMAVRRLEADMRV